MTPEKKRRALAVKGLIEMGWNPPTPTDEIAARIFDDIVSVSSDRRRHDNYDLTEKELRILSLLASGFNRNGVAERMNCSEETVKDRIKKLFQKLGARNAPHAVAIAYRSGLLGDTELREAA